MTVAFYELRARTRVILGWWVEASKDVLMALKGIEDGSDLGCDSSNEEEERAELSFWPINRS